MLAKIKVHQLGSNIEDLPIMQTHMLTKLLAMNACVQIGYSGVGLKADAWHIAHFLKSEKDGVTLRAFKSMKDFQEFIDTIEKCFCAIALEGRADRAFFRDIFRPTRENLYDAARKTKLDDLSMDWMAYELAMIFSQWAQLYTDTQYATMEFEAFKQLNLAALHFDNTDWRDECKRADQAAMPIQRVNPPCKATPTTAPARGYKRGRGAAPAIGTPGAKRQKTMPRPPTPAAAPPGPPKGRQASGARPSNMFAASAP